MNLSLIFSVLTGVSLLVAFGALMLWQILSAPDRPNYPTSGKFKRLVMFWFSASLLYRATEILFAAFADDPIHTTEGQMVSAMLLGALMVTFVVDHCLHWLPARTHANIRRLVTIARCPPSRGLKAARTSSMKNSTGASCPSADVVSPALAELVMQGARVVGPNASPEALG